MKDEMLKYQKRIEELENENSFLKENLKLSPNTNLNQELINAKNRVEESELIFRKLFEESSDAILLIDAAGDFVECNPAALDLLKMTREQFLFQSPANISPHYQSDGRKSDEAALEMIKLAYQKGLHRFDWTCMDAQGGEFMVEVSLMPIVVKGQTMLHTTWRDITERKQTEIELKKAKEKAEESADRFHSIFENTQAGYFFIDKDGLFQDVNQAWLNLYKYERLDEVKGKHFTKVQQIDDIEKAKEFVEGIRNGNPEYMNGEFSRKCKDGSIGYHTFSARPVYSEKKDIGIEGFLIDITKQKAIENELKKEKEIAQKNEEYLRLINNATFDQIYSYDLESRFTSANKELCRNLKRSADDIIGKSYWELDFPEENCRAWDELHRQTYLKGQITEIVSTPMPDGTIQFFEVNLFLLKDNDGKALGITGVNRNITKSKHAEKELIKAKEKALESERKLIEAQKLSHVGSWEYVIDTDTVTWSEELYTIFERSNDLPAPKYSEQPSFYTKEGFAILDKAVQDCIQREIPYEIELDIITSSGKIKQIISKGRVVKDKNNKILGCYGTAQDITQKKKIEQELIKAKEKAEQHTIDLKLAQQIANIGNWQFDPEVGIPVWSDHVFEIYERTPGQGLPKLDDFKNIYEPDQYEIFNKAISEAIKEGKAYDVILKLILPSKHIKWIRAICKPDLSRKSKSGYFLRGTIQDITNIKKAEIELQKAKEKAEESQRKLEKQGQDVQLSNARLESLLRISQFPTNSIQKLLDFALQEAILLTNSKIGYIYFYNEEKKQFTLNSWSKDVMKACAVMDSKIVYNLDSTGFWGEAVRQRKPIILNNYHAQNSLKKGIPKGHIDLTKFLTIPVIFENKIVAVAGVANKDTDYDNADVRQLTLLMDTVWKISERISLIDILKIAKEKAEESDKLKTEFINNMSHEIRTPMNGILGFSNFLNKENLSTEKRKHYIRIIQSTGNQLLRIIDDILEISKLGTKQVVAIETEIDLNDLCLELFSIFDIKAKENKTPLYLKKGLSDQESKIFTDESKLNKILSNLLDNALKYTNEGFIELGYQLILKDSDQASQLEIYVKDTGIGISVDKQETVFERFSQEEKELSKKFGGLGLGLSIAKENAELLGGKITLESEKGKGSIFRITIPYKPANDHKEKGNSNQKENKTEKSDQYSILIVEDEEVNFLYIETLFEDDIDLNCTILHAKNGKEAVEICQENKDIRFVLMDIKMPIMNGFEATKQIKAFRPDLPIVAQTAYTSTEDKEKAFTAGCDDFISKPIYEEIFREIINKYLINKINAGS